jgi:hypothetical protein
LTTGKKEGTADTHNRDMQKIKQKSLPVKHIQKSFNNFVTVEV